MKWLTATRFLLGAHEMGSSANDERGELSDQPGAAVWPPPLRLAESERGVRYLSLVERKRIATLRERGHGVREIARRVERAPLQHGRADLDRLWSPGLRRYAQPSRVLSIGCIASEHDAPFHYPTHFVGCDR